MYFKYLRIMLGLVLCLSSTDVLAYGRYASTTRGVEYWLTYLNNNGVADADKSLRLEVTVTAETACEVVVEVAGKVVTNLTIPAGGGEATYCFPTPSLVYSDATGNVGNKGVHVYTKDRATPFSCYTYSQTGEDNSPLRDMSLVLPKEALGQEYIVQTYSEDNLSTEFSVVATEATTLSIYPSVETKDGKGPASPIENITLKKGEVYSVQSQTKDQAGKDPIDLSGSRICSNRPVAVFAGNQKTRISFPSAAYSDNHSYEQLLPIVWQGTEFYYTLTGNEYTTRNLIRITSAFENTGVQLITPIQTETKTLGVGESLNKVLLRSSGATDLTIKADKPILVMAYTYCGGYNPVTYDDGTDVSWGNPTVAMVPAWSHRVDTMDFVIDSIASLAADYVEYYVQLTASTATCNSVMLDGISVDATLWKPFSSDPTMSYANVPVMEIGRHVLTSEGEGFVGTVLGQADGQAYAYTLGYAPRPKRDSLFQKEESGELIYRMQYADCRPGEEHLDTVVVCDSTEIGWLSRLAGDIDTDSLVWRIFAYDDQDKITSTFEVSESAGTLVPGQSDYEWSYQFILDRTEKEQELKKKPEERKPYRYYELQQLLYRMPLVCEDKVQVVDTLQTLVMVTRQYNDTVLQRVICRGDSIESFLDNGKQDADGYWLREEDPKFDCKTMIVSEATPTDSFHLNYVLGDQLYTRRYRTMYGCDSVAMIYLHVCDTFYTERDTSFCEGDTLWFDTPEFKRTKPRFRQGISVAGTYCDTLKTTQCDEYKKIDPTFRGCDSVFVLNVTMCDTTYRMERDTICEKTWVGHKDKITGLDRVFTFRSPGMRPIVSGGDTLRWMGTYFDSLKTETPCPYCKEGCDSIYELRLVIPKSYRFESAQYCDSVFDEHKVLRRNEDYVWIGHDTRTLWVKELGRRVPGDTLGKLAAGNYLVVDSMISEQYGCDSVRALRLEVVNNSMLVCDTTVCRNASKFKFGRQQKEIDPRTLGSTYYYEYTDMVNIPGLCQRLERLQVHICDTFYIVETVDTICKGGTYTWRGNVYNGNTAGTFTYTFDTITKSCGCDSVMALQLTVLPSYEVEEKKQMSEEDTLRWQHTLYVGIKNRETITPQTGISIRTVKPDVYDTAYNYQTTAVGSYRCDSIFSLRLTVGAVYRDTTEGYTCDNVNYEWHGTTRSGQDTLRWSGLPTKDTVLTNEFKTVLGYDSIFYHFLKVRPTYFYETYDTICQRDENYVWKKHESLVIPATVDGDFLIYDSLETDPYGCDSVHLLYLHIWPTYNEKYHTEEVTDYRVICDNDSVDWEGQRYRGWRADGTYTGYKEGTYYDERVVGPATGGCDSVRYLVLTVLHTDSVVDSRTICNDDVFHWGVNNVYTWDGSWQLAAHDVRDTLVTKNELLKNNLGCDSLAVLKLTVHPTYLFITDTAFCADKVKDLVWRGRSGFELSAKDLHQTYYDSLRTKTHGCDSVYQLNLTVYPNMEVEYSMDICDGDTIDWMEQKIYAPLPVKNPYTVDYTARYTTQEGCNGYAILHATFRPHYHRYVSAEVCDNGMYDFEGRIYSASLWRSKLRRDTVIQLDTTYYTTGYGCDSTITHYVTVHPTWYIETIDTTCQTSTYVWEGHGDRIVVNTDVPGDYRYYDSLSTEHYGCDSVHLLRLHVASIYRHEDNRQMCDNELLEWQNRLYVGKNYEGELPDVTAYEAVIRDVDHDYTGEEVHRAAVSGCDSLFVLNLSVSGRDLVVWSDETCDNQPYLFCGYWLTKSGFYCDTLVNRYGCDSICQLSLTVHPTYAYYDTLEAICSGERYEWHGRHYSSTVAKVVYDTLHAFSIHGCDSIYYLKLQIHQSYHWDEEYHLCADEVRMDWHTHRIEYDLDETRHWRKDSVMVYYDNRTSLHGCDSSYTMTLTVHPVDFVEVDSTKCQGEYYLSPSKKYRWTESGTYTDTTYNEAGCRIFHTIRLTIKQPTAYEFTVRELCADDPVIHLDYTYVGDAPQVYSALFDSMGHSQFFYDQMELPLNPHLGYLEVDMPVAGTDKRQYPRPNRYALQIMMDNGICRDSSLLLFPVEVEVNYPSWIIEQHWNDAIGILVPELNGLDVVTHTGYTFASYQWYRNDSVLYGETRPYLFDPHGMKQGSTYRVELVREGETDSVKTCTITASDLVKDGLVTTMPFVSVVPTLVDHRSPIVHILSTDPGNYTLYTGYGIEVESGRFSPDEHHAYDLALPGVTGIYVVELLSDSGESRTVKIVVE